MALGLMALVPGMPADAGETFACNMRALSKAERARYEVVVGRLADGILEVKEIGNGYGFRFQAAELMTVAEWVSLERRCCPFFGFEIEQARDQGALWLRVTGSEGIKPFIRAEFGL